MEAASPTLVFEHPPEQHPLWWRAIPPQHNLRKRSVFAPGLFLHRVFLFCFSKISPSATERQYGHLS
jgi:hypothetical protein